MKPLSNHPIDDRMMTDVLKMRAFNRFHTRLVGALNEGHLTSEFSLVQVRVLYELNHGKNVAAKDLMETLQLDRGYLSRLLTDLENQNLIKRTPDRHNAKRLVLSLTAHGQKISDELELTSSRDVAKLLEPFSHDERARLIRAMGFIQSQLQQKPEDDALILRDPDPGDLGWIVHRYATIFSKEFGLDQTFEGLVASIVSDYVRLRLPDKERCWIAEYGGEIVGSIFLIQSDASDLAKIRLLYVEPSARGLGIGGRLVDEAIKFAKQKNYSKISLWTHKTQNSAVKIYQSRGFEMVSAKIVHDFGQTDEAQIWELNLSNSLKTHLE